MANKFDLPYVRFITTGEKLEFINKNDAESLSFIKESFIQFISTDNDSSTYRCLSSTEEVEIKNEKLYSIKSEFGISSITSSLPKMSRNMEGVYDDTLLKKYIDTIYNRNMTPVQYIEFYGNIIMGGNLYYLKKMRDIVKHEESVDQVALFNDLVNANNRRYINLAKLIMNMDKKYGFYLDDIIIHTASLAINK